MRVVALDYGAARTGVAVSDASGTIARPVGVVERVGTDAGFARLRELIVELEAELMVVGMPVTLGGELGEQARETSSFVEVLRTAFDVPVETYDERFTTVLAQRTPTSVGEDAAAAAHLLQSWLDRTLTA